MGKLLSTFDQPVKKPFQLYTIEHGIERLSVKVPLNSASVFEQQANGLKSKARIIELVKSLGGKVVNG